MPNEQVTCRSDRIFEENGMVYVRIRDYDGLADVVRDGEYLREFLSKGQAVLWARQHAKIMAKRDNKIASRVFSAGKLRKPSQSQAGATH